MSDKSKNNKIMSMLKAENDFLRGLMFESLGEEYKNSKLINSGVDLGTWVENTIISWDKENISKNTKLTSDPNSTSKKARDYDLDMFGKRVEVKSTQARLKSTLEDVEYEVRATVPYGYEGKVRYGIRGIRKTGLWDYLIMCVIYADTEVFYLFSYDDMDSDKLGITLSPHNLNQSTDNRNYQITMSEHNIGNLDKFIRTKEEILEFFSKKGE